jgi:hypothetical protein
MNQFVAKNKFTMYQALWTVPSQLPAGVYTVKIGIFSSDWSQLYTWNDNAAQITVT